MKKAKDKESELFQIINEAVMNPEDSEKVLQVLLTIKSKFEIMQDVVERIDKAVNGNGKEGLCEKYEKLNVRTNRLEDRAGILKYVVVLVVTQIVINVVNLVVK